MSSPKVEYVRSIFFECYKVIENVHSLGSWFCICHQYSGCQSIKDFIKGQKRYCCIFQLQDSLNLNCFCGMVDRRKHLSLISSRDHCQKRSLPSQISDTPRAGCEPAQNLSSGFVEWSWPIREVNKLKNYYMDIMVAVCEIKKVTACEDNFWERDIHYVIKNNGIHTYFNEMKYFLFQS